MFFVNQYRETDRGTFVCVSSRAFYVEEEAQFHADRMCREGDGDSDYICQDLNMKGKEVDSL